MLALAGSVQLDRSSNIIAMVLQPAIARLAHVARSSDSGYLHSRASFANVATANAKYTAARIDNLQLRYG